MSYNPLHFIDIETVGQDSQNSNSRVYTILPNSWVQTSSSNSNHGNVGPYEPNFQQQGSSSNTQLVYTIAEALEQATAIPLEPTPAISISPFEPVNFQNPNNVPVQVVKEKRKYWNPGPTSTIIPSKSSIEDIERMFRSNGIKESVHEIMSMDSKGFVSYKNGNGFSSEQKKLIQVARRILVRRSREKRVTILKRPRQFENKLIPPNSTNEDIQTLLVKSGIDDSIESLMDQNTEAFHKYRMSEKFTPDQQKLLSVARKRLKKRYLYIQRRTEESSLLMNEDFPKGVLRTPEQLQEILYRHGIDIKIEELCALNKKEIQDKFQSTNEKQKEVLKQVRHRLASLLAGNSLCTKELKEKLNFTTTDHNLLEIEANEEYEIIIPINATEDQIQDFLVENGITESISTFMSMDGLDFVRYVGCNNFNAKQKYLLKHIRRLRKRNKTYRRRMALSLATTEDFPKGILRTPEQLQNILYKYEINVTIKQLLTMDQAEYDSFKKDSNFTPDQLDVIYKVKNRVANFHHANSVLLLEYLKEQDAKNPEDAAKELPSTSQKTPTIQIIKNPVYIPAKPTESQVQEILEKAGIKEPIETIMNLNSRDFSAYRASVDFNEEQRNLLQKIRYKLKSKNLNDESKTIAVDPLSLEMLNTPKRKYNKSAKYKNQEKIVKKISKNMLLVIEKSNTKETQTDDFNFPANGGASSSSATTTSGGGPTSSLFPSNSQEEERVNIQVNYQGQKIFTKASKLYPGHVYTFYFKSAQPDVKFPNGVEFYDCANCVNTAYASLNAQRSAQVTTKTIVISNGKIIFGSYDGVGHVCVPLEMVQKRYQTSFRS